MGHSKGRDNAKKRAKRRKKTERLALARKNSGEHARAGTARVDGNAARVAGTSVGTRVIK